MNIVTGTIAVVKQNPLTPLQLGKLDATDGFPFAPEYFSTYAQKAAYARGFMAVQANAAAAAFLGLTFVSAEVA